MIEKLKNFLKYANEHGIMIPLLYDPLSKSPSVTLTLVVISSNIVLVGMLGKLSNLLGGVDLTQAIYWNLLCLGAYLGRTLIRNKQEKEE